MYFYCMITPKRVSKSKIDGIVLYKSLLCKQKPLKPLSLQGIKTPPISFQTSTYHEPEPFLLMGWLRSLVSPLKKLWDRLHSHHRKRRGIYILYRDVKSCPCEDVQVLWSILVESGTGSLHQNHDGVSLAL